MVSTVVASELEGIWGWPEAAIVSMDNDGGPDSGTETIESCVTSDGADMLSLLLWSETAESAEGFRGANLLLVGDGALVSPRSRCCSRP